MNATKIRLSAREAELVGSAELILTKNAILKKVWVLLEMIQEEQKQIIGNMAKSLPAVILKPAAKISKGENYKGLPYLVLDYPRFFDQSAVFAIRTLFWWGNFFSITLHLAGDSKKMFEEKIAAAYPLWREFYFCVNDDPWEHHFEKSNYADVSGLGLAGFEKAVREKSFIKLAKKIPFDQWEESPLLLLNGFREITGILSA